jgi:hypothetical protein
MKKVAFVVPLGLQPNFHFFIQNSIKTQCLVKIQIKNSTISYFLSKIRLNEINIKYIIVGQSLVKISFLINFALYGDN